MRVEFLPVVALLGAAAPVARAVEPMAPVSPRLEVRPVMIDAASAIARDDAPSKSNQPATQAGQGGGEAGEGQTPAPQAAAPRFGRPGAWWITLGGGYANDFEGDHDFNLHGAVSAFLATELEFAVELGGWYFKQEGPDTGGVNGSMIFRWHFLHDDDFAWTIYADAGIGLLGAFNEVPDGGTNFNFTPRAGLGFTHQIGDGPARFQLGVRYHHISNGRLEGDGSNPSRDAIMVYAGIIFPW